MPYELKTKNGRPPVPFEKVQEVMRLADKGVAPKVAIQETGLSQGKVYEIYRILALYRSLKPRTGATE